MIDKIMDKLWDTVNTFKAEGYSAQSIYWLMNEVVKFVENEFPQYKGAKKKALALEVCDEIFDMVNIDLGWIYRWAPRWIVKAVFMWACKKAINKAVDELNKNGFFTHE